MTDAFEAMLIQDVDGKPKAGLADLTLADLPDNEVLVKISHSSLNYKDGLAITGKGRIARRLPMVAGIDLAGVVVESRSLDWRAGDRVLVNGWGLSETEWGAYSHFQRLKPQHLTTMPTDFSAEEAMAIGTAGYTAALCVLALERHGVLKGDGEFLVTGAAGGVGTVAISLLAARGVKVIASTGRVSEEEFLMGLGASGIIDRGTLSTQGKMLQAERWSGGVDSVGSHTLVNALAQTVYGGAIAACGLAGGADLPGSVMPHILRSVALLGVDSVMCPQARRAEAWALLNRDLDRKKLAALTTVAPMADLPKLAEEIVAGRIRGRTVIEIG
ncbi:MAG: oxidoreductase [Paracoccus sp.]|jgi:acrylyl-CoA reductase (NADPH)|nr:oxidoreductase [Paracoccus sp. (in: a-proteobacteria)]MBP9048944.1 oxidoreductase [Tabrizicola sp.]HRA55418.1 MDR family oxidoreductase [Thermoflexales bacterium]